MIVSRITQRSAEHLKLSEGLAVWAQIKSMAVLR
jgi:molybdopterin-binding protein